jgi:hypothetical protein
MFEWLFGKKKKKPAKKQTLKVLPPPATTREAVSQIQKENPDVDWEFRRKAARAREDVRRQILEDDNYARQALEQIRRWMRE